MTCLQLHRSWNKAQYGTGTFWLVLLAPLDHSPHQYEKQKGLYPCPQNQQYLHRKSFKARMKSILSKWGCWTDQARVICLMNKNYYLEKPTIYIALQTLTIFNNTMQLLATRGQKGSEQNAVSLLTCLGIEKNTTPTAAYIQNQLPALKWRHKSSFDN